MDCTPYLISITSLYLNAQTDQITGIVEINPCDPMVEGYVEKKDGNSVIKGSITYKGLIFAVDSEGEAYYFKPLGEKK